MQGAVPLGGVPCGTGERADFLARLLAAAEPTSRLRVVLGGRADFYGC